MSAISQDVRTVTIFISSPGDVPAERELIETIVRRVNETQAAAAGIQFRVFRWEQHVVPRIGTKPQQVVDDQTPTYDVYMGLMSKRFGTPTDRYGSGTEAEFREALRQSQQRGSPWILFYFDDEAAASLTSADEALQFEQVQRFRSELNQLGLVASYRGLHGPEGSLFERVDRHLRLLIAKLTQRSVAVIRDDFQSLIRNHLDSYLAPRVGTVFVGRKPEIDRALNWIETADRGKLLVTGRAGIGKSAFLSHLQALLRQRLDVDIVFFPISIRFGTNLATVFFPSLLSQIAAARGEAPPPGFTSVEKWRAQVSDYLSRPHTPPGRRLVVIVDGLDEATGWAPDVSLWPVVLGEGVHVIVGARPLAGDRDASAWLSRLGWDVRDDAQVLTLSALTRGAVVDAVRAVRGEGPSSEVVGRELWRLTAGDPLTLDAYLKELASSPEMTAEGLVLVAPGISGLMDRWWQEQRVIWGSNYPLREEKVRTVLGLVACALGPISRDDLIAVAGSEHDLAAWSIKDAVVAFGRILEGDDTSGYSYTHPRMREFVESSQFDRHSLRRYRDRYRTWSRETLSALESGDLEPAAVPAYQLRYLAAHLREEGVGSDVTAGLLSRQWIEASRRFDTSGTELVNDCDYVLSTAAAALRNQPPEQPRPAATLGTHFRAVLSRASVASLALVLPASLLRALVELGEWTLNQALSYARRHYFPSHRFSGLVALLDFADLVRRQDLLDEILALITTAIIWERPKDLLPPLGAAIRSREELVRAIESIERIERVDTRAAAIGILAANCEILFDWWAPTERLIDCAVSSFRRDESECAEALATVAHLVPHEHRTRVLDRTTWLREYYQQKVLLAFLPTDTPNRLRSVLESLSEEQRLTAVAHVPWQTVPDLAAQEADRVVTVAHPGTKLYFLAHLLPHLEGDTKHRLGQVAVEAAVALPSDSRSSGTYELLVRAVALEYPNIVQPLMKACEFDAFNILDAAAEHLQPEDVQHLASQLPRPEDRELALIKWVAPTLDVWRREELVESALTTAEAADPYACTELLKQLAGHLNTEQVERARALTRFMPAWNRDRAQILLLLAGRVPDEQRRSYFEEAIEVVASLSGDQWAAKHGLLDAMAPLLPASLLPATIAASEAIRDMDSQAKWLIAIGQRLRGRRRADVIRRATGLVRQAEDVDTWAELTTSLIPILPPASRERMALDAAEDVLGEFNEKQLLLFTVSLAALPHAPRQYLVKRAWAAVHEESDPKRRALAAVRLLPHLRNLKKVSSLILGTVPGISDPNERAPIIRDAFRHLPPSMVAVALEWVRREPVDWARAEMFAALGPAAPAEVLVEAEKATSSGDEVLAAWIFSGVLRAHRAARRRALDRLTDILRTLNGSDLATALWYAEPELDEAVAQRILPLTDEIWDHVELAQARAVLLPYLPELLRRRTIQGILPLLDAASDGQRTAVVRRIAAVASMDTAANCLEYFVEAKWAPQVRALAPIAARAALLSPGRCADLWCKTAELFLTHETAGRRWALPRFASLVPLLYGAGGEEALWIAAAEASAVFEIWP